MADDYRVGYCRPPLHTRFQPGKSPNPAGRPRGSKGLRAELKAELDERVSITVEGRIRKIPKRRLIIKALAAKAAKGEVRAADKLLSLVIQAEGFEDQRQVSQGLSETDRRILERLMGEGAGSLDVPQSATVPVAGDEPSGEGPDRWPPPS